ncbi:SUMF1/EgtB/PvdO family nonheme iron enzyme [Bosea sp. BK604]|uniref:SUMF1/EgtB/PvdO family nonheme iron enzyme n=1 Tax=Bosea sp. BK604 TaxID=2512180 RepID=UPI0010439FD1|nr:SUMF1/EgtB/PvdO family nonheme iron enzyme [Bosea sp. BK604]TCR64304.1 formylglycine-generating enzyme required for sulfatase activity [Bosea sp. BK604]
MALHRCLSLVGATLACALAWLSPPALAQTGAAEQPARIALVIGNSSYGQAALPEAASDARSVAETLRQGGFDVVAAENADTAAMQRAAAEFAGKLRRGAQVVVFYSGHAVQFRNRNFLVAPEAQLRSAQDVPREALDLDRILDPLIVARPASAVIVLDASLDNPWQDGIAKGVKGLAAIEAIENIAAVFAAPPGRTVAAGPGRSNAFADEWLKAIRTPGLDMAAALIRTRDAVTRLTRRGQQVWVSAAPAAGLIVTPVNRPAAVASRTVISPAPPQSGSGDQADAFELSFWDTIRNSENSAEYRAYLDAYPNGRFAALARAREQLYRQKPGAAAAPAPIQAPAATPAAAQAQAKTLRDCSFCPELTLIPAGSFEMGSNEMFEFEKPVHQVTIRAPFYLGTREVSFAEWDSCVDQGGCSQRPSDRNLGRGRRPVTDVSWEDANAYTAWLSAKTGKRYRLPTEAEWEYAARAGSNTTYPWGRNLDKEMANCLGCNAQQRRQTIESGQYPPNAFGLYDMAGNAAEWVADCWGESYRTTPRDGSAYTAPACRERVLRGGSFNNDPRYLRSAARFKYEADVRFYTNGFRVLREQ